MSRYDLSSGAAQIQICTALPCIPGISLAESEIVAVAIIAI